MKSVTISPCLLREAREHGGRRQTVERGRLLRTIMTGMYGPGENVVQSDANRKARLEIDL